MVRPYYPSLRGKQRPFSSFRNSQESHSGMQYADGYSSHSRTRRDPVGHPMKPPWWRESARGGASHFSRRPDSQWGSRQRSPAHGFPAQMGYINSHRRGSPHWSGHTPPMAPRWRSPVSHGHRPSASQSPPPRAPFSGRFSPSPPRCFHNEPSHRRLPPLARRSPHRSSHRRHSAGPESGPGWTPGMRRDHRPRGDVPTRSERWNGAGVFGYSPSPQQRSHEFHGRSPYQERLSTELEARKHGRNEMEREGGGRGSAWVHEHSPRYAHKSPKWRVSPSTSASSSPRFHHHSEEKPLKRRNQEEGSGFEHHAKRARREASQRPPIPRGFGGRPLSLKDKSRLLKGRMLRGASEVRVKVSPQHSREIGNTEKLRRPKPWSPKEKEEKEKPSSEEGKVRQEAAEARPLKKPTLKKVSPKSHFAAEGADDQQRGTETLTIKVDTRHTLTNYSSSSSSSSDRQLSLDLVTVSKKGLASRSEACISDRWKNKSQEAQENCSGTHENQKQTLTLNERFSKLQNQHLLARGGNERYSGLKIERKIDVPFLNHKTVRIRKTAPPSKPVQHPISSEAKPSIPQRLGSVRRPVTFKRPLMATVVPRPSFHQNPVFKKSQSITTKYRHMQVLRYPVILPPIIEVLPMSVTLSTPDDRLQELPITLLILHLQ
ncbi:serine/arginine repetitive matrix protein 1-like isoform X1 [Arapaima gigas]